MASRGAKLMAVYERLRSRFGPAGWWPAETPFEVCLGAILTQNTAWANVERALGVLRARGRLSFEGLRGLSADSIAPWIRSSGTYRVKARRVASFVRFLETAYGGSVAAMAEEAPEVLRRKLLSVDGVGPETADSIALYAAAQPVFVVDAYTRRIFARLGLLGGEESYEEIQRLFTDRLPRDAALFNDYHAQIVRLGKDACRPRPRCEACPVGDLCPRVGVDGAAARASQGRGRRRHEESC